MSEDEIHGFEYYIVGVVPVKVLLDNYGRYMGARIPDRQTRSLIKAARYLGYVMDGEDVVEIDEDRFKEECKKFYDTKPKKFW